MYRANFPDFFFDAGVVKFDTFRISCIETCAVAQLTVLATAPANNNHMVIHFWYFFYLLRCLLLDNAAREMFTLPEEETLAGNTSCVVLPAGNLFDTVLHFEVTYDFGGREHVVLALEVA